MRGVLAVLLVGAVLIVAFSGGALSYGMATASYSPDGNMANVVAMGGAGGRVRVFGEQPDGAYALVATGTFGSSGALEFTVPAVGPRNAMPQYRVMISDSDGNACISIADKEYAFD
jgi:hypothetical protein